MNDMKNKNIVIGGGLSGAVIANLIAEKLNEKVLILEKKNCIAGHCFDYKDENGICIHKYGSHIFHTNNEKIWKYVNQFGTFNTYMHKVVALIDGIETTIPFNINTIHNVFPRSMALRLEEKLLNKYAYNSKVPILEFQNADDKDLNFLACYIYEKVFKNYTVKQWGLKPENIDSVVMTRVPVYVSKDNRYFQDTYQGIPHSGYTELISNMLKHPNIEIKYNTQVGKSIALSDIGGAKRIFSTASIDELLNYKYGKLPYRSVNFKFETYNREFYQSNSVVNYPCNYDFTRIHEYKHYSDNKTSNTVIAKEYSEDFKEGENERFYPVRNDINNKLYEKYALELPNNVYCLGRLGDFEYYDMDKAIKRAICLFEKTALSGLKL